MEVETILMDKKSIRRKNIMVICLFIIIFFMTVGYGSAVKTLTVANDNLYASNWSVGFVSVIPKKKCKDSKNVSCGQVYDFDIGTTSLTFNTKFTNLDSVVTYKIRVKNFGNVDAKIAPNGIQMNILYDDSVISYAQSGLVEGETTLGAGKSLSFTLTVTADQNGNFPKRHLDNSLTMYINWIQA